jgi:hypothetical protein
MVLVSGLVVFPPLEQFSVEVMLSMAVCSIVP